MILHVGDLEPTLELTVTRSGSAVNLSTATGVAISGWLDGTQIISSAAATVTDAAGGVIQRAWQSADTDTAGTLRLEVEITWPSSRKETVAVSSNVRILP